METLTTMTTSQLTDFVTTFERNAFNQAVRVDRTVRAIEHALERGDTTNAVPTDTPSTLTGRPLTPDEVKTVIYRDVHELYADTEARYTISDGETPTLTPITPEGFDENMFTTMWTKEYCKANDYEHMSEQEQDAFDKKTLDFWNTHVFYIVDLNAQLGELLQSFGWDKSKTAFPALAYYDKYELANFLIIPENGGKVEDMLCADPKEARSLGSFISHSTPELCIDERVNGYAARVDVLRCFAEAYASLHDIELSDSVLRILANMAADQAKVFALPLNTVDGRALATLWGIPEEPSFADNLTLYQAHQVIVRDGTIYSMKTLYVEAA